jgi:hypothetical protein
MRYDDDESIYILIWRERDSKPFTKLWPVLLRFMQRNRFSGLLVSIRKDRIDLKSIERLVLAPIGTERDLFLRAPRKILLAKSLRI